MPALRADESKDVTKPALAKWHPKLAAVECPEQPGRRRRARPLRYNRHGQAKPRHGICFISLLDTPADL